MSSSPSDKYFAEESVGADHCVRPTSLATETKYLSGKLYL
jgi:hypothetical protein